MGQSVILLLRPAQPQLVTVSPSNVAKDVLTGGQLVLRAHQSHDVQMSIASAMTL